MSSLVYIPFGALAALQSAGLDPAENLVALYLLSVSYSDGDRRLVRYPTYRMEELIQVSRPTVGDTLDTLDAGGLASVPVPVGGRRSLPMIDLTPLWVAAGRQGAVVPAALLRALTAARLGAAERLIVLYMLSRARWVAGTTPMEDRWIAVWSVADAVRRLGVTAGEVAWTRQHALQLGCSIYREPDPAAHQATVVDVTALYRLCAEVAPAVAAPAAAVAVAAPAAVAAAVAAQRNRWWN